MNTKEEAVGNGAINVADEMDMLLHLEDQFHAEGVSESQQVSSSCSSRAGRSTGWSAGSILSAELEYYRGGACALLALAKAHPEVISERATTAAQALVQEATKVDIRTCGNDDQVDFESHCQLLRGRFTQMCAFAALPSLPFPRPKSKVSDYSF